MVLDRQWCRLNRPVVSLRDGEAAGWRPSLIVSPMIVETGERLLISNLDLSAIAQPESVTRTPCWFVPATITADALEDANPHAASV